RRVLFRSGGGGLAAGISSFFKRVNPKVTCIGVEPEGAPSMQAAFENGGPVELDKINKFVDGASVKRVGDLNYQIVKDNIDSLKSIHEGKVCTCILELYNKDAIVVEPTGELGITALEINKRKK